ncbi:MAG: ThuA domain-containing protein [Pseudobacter sp.]|uniref:ThuA domain-containing protein n=1 Tax=Pseudobacter sp. TaxID=2045420 RepID=UPI003F81B508
MRFRILYLLLLQFSYYGLFAQNHSIHFKAIAFFTGKNDLAHISFVHEANKWFSEMSKQHHFSFDSTSDWSKLNDTVLSAYQVVIFLDTRPDSIPQREAFRRYMEKGGAWMGFHFSAFALTPSAYPQNWDWYHNDFLGSGEYDGNTWRPTAAMLKVEDGKHPVTKGVPAVWKSAPNEWYKWTKDLRRNAAIRILLSIDSSSFPLGTGPKPQEIWHSGYYPVAWTNTKYRMVYFNMGHNDMDYEHGTNKELSATFGNKVQNKCILQSLLWLGKIKRFNLSE